jgi:hypothetical protein
VKTLVHKGFNINETINSRNKTSVEFLFGSKSKYHTCTNKSEQVLVTRISKIVNIKLIHLKVSHFSAKISFRFCTVALVFIRVDSLARLAYLSPAGTFPTLYTETVLCCRSLIRNFLIIRFLEQASYA